MIKAYIIDDEAGAIKNLEFFLLKYSDNIELIGSSTSTKDAELKIKLLKPDVLFIDINMPRESGIEFLQRINYYDFDVVFVTAYNDFAIQAFRLNALDYILKPINPVEIQQCIKKITETQTLKVHFRDRLLKEQLVNFTEAAHSKKHKQLILKNKGSIEIIQFDQIISISGDGSYSNFHFLSKGIPSFIVMSYPLAYYENLLPTGDFLRVHKSHIVHKLFIQEITRDPNYTIITKYGTKIPISKRRVSQILEQL